MEATHRSCQRLVHDALVGHVLDVPNQPATPEGADAVAELDLGPRSWWQGLDADDSDARSGRHDSREIRRVVEEGERRAGRCSHTTARSEDRHGC
jgi:hypothetical protein